MEKEETTFNYRKSLKRSTNTFVDKLKYVDIYINRPVASLIVRAVFNTRVTPNGITYTSFFIGMLAAFFFTKGEYLYFILGGTLAQVSSIVDGADGMLARAKDICTDYGAMLDLFFDRIIDFSLFICISVGAGSYFKNSSLLILGILGAGLYLLQTSLFYITKSFQGLKETGETGELRAIMILVMFIFSVINRLDIYIYLGFSTIIILNVVRLIYFLSLGRKKQVSLSNGFEHSQESQTSQQQ
jgi:CDP-L-myo-inositol myo-inositolphosphotransferase